MKLDHKEANKQFVLPLENNQRATVSYRLGSCSGMRLVHSEVPPLLRGKGFGKDLIKNKLTV